MGFDYGEEIENESYLQDYEELLKNEAKQSDW
jgi:hypothetical protein